MLNERLPFSILDIFWILIQRKYFVIIPFVSFVSFIFCNLKQYSIKESIWNCEKVLFRSFKSVGLGIQKIDLISEIVRQGPRRGSQNV